MTPEQEAIKAEAIRDAGRIFAMGRAKRDSLPAQAAAEAAWYPGHPLGSVDAIRELIVSQRAEARQRIAAAANSDLPAAA